MLSTKSSGESNRGLTFMAEKSTTQSLNQGHPQVGGLDLPSFLFPLVTVLEHTKGNTLPEKKEILYKRNKTRKFPLTLLS